MELCNFLYVLFSEYVLKNLLHWITLLINDVLGLGPLNRSSLFRVLLFSDHHPLVLQP